MSASSYAQEWHKPLNEFARSLPSMLLMVVTSAGFGWRQWYGLDIRCAAMVSIFLVSTAAFLVTDMAALAFDIFLLIAAFLVSVLSATVFDHLLLVAVF